MFKETLMPELVSPSTIFESDHQFQAESVPVFWDIISKKGNILLAREKAITGFIAWQKACIPEAFSECDIRKTPLEKPAAVDKTNVKISKKK
jgi:hypothetical protein